MTDAQVLQAVLAVGLALLGVFVLRFIVTGH